MHLEVTIPEEYLGPVTSDLRARRADMMKMDPRQAAGNRGARPLARMFDYSEKVRSLTQGRAGWTMEPDRYTPAPEDVVRSLGPG